MVAGSVLTWTIPGLAGASATLSYTETTDAPRRAGVRYHLRLGDERPELHGQHHVGRGRGDPRRRPHDRRHRRHRRPSPPVRPAPTRSRSPTTGRRPPPTPPSPAPSTQASPQCPPSPPSAGRPSPTSAAVDFPVDDINLDGGASATLSIMGTASSSLTAGSAFVNLAITSLPRARSIRASPRAPSTRTRSSSLLGDQLHAAGSRYRRSVGRPVGDRW